jgi:T4-like virus Myoviridae tail sheath stabiliser
MEHFYDGQIRRYITQTIRALSNFVVKYGDGTLVRIPVMYGDADRQAASIIRNNSENKVNSVPRISVYVTGLALDRDRLSDQTFVGTVNIRERDIDPNTNRYTTGQGRNYTIERLMPTPFKLTMKCDIWSANTDQKLQILEQILVLFNPSLELQTTDNYVDWTSLTVLNLNDINWDSRTVPVGNDTPIDIATLTLDTPIWINPPVKVKHLGVITKIITSMYNNSATSGTYIEGLGQDPVGPTTSMEDLLGLVIGSSENYRLEVYNGQAKLVGAHDSVVDTGHALEMPLRFGTPVNWQEVFNKTPGKYKAGSSQIYLTQPNGSQIVGTFAINSLESTILQVSWNPDTLTVNTGIDSSGNLDNASGYNLQNCKRPGSPGTFDAIVDPQQFDPKKPNKEAFDQTIPVGTRYLIIEDLGSDLNDAGKGPKAWQSTTGVDFVAHANDIIEWSGTQWNIIFNASQNSDTMVWQTNIYTGIQYLWNGVSWVKSFEGVYEANNWKIVL